MNNWKSKAEGTKAQRQKNNGQSSPIRSFLPTGQAIINLMGVGFVCLFLLFPFSVQAGNLDSPAAPTAAGSAMFTITDIYNRLDTGATVTKRAGAFTEPSAGPASTGKTLDEVKSLIDSRAHATCNTAGSATLNGTRWCDNGDGTVTDLTTGLMWLKDASWGTQIAFWVTPSTGVNAHDRAVQVENGTPASLTDGSVEGDWRLPTLKELKALTASGTEDVFSGTMRAFTGVLMSFYWSSATAGAGSPQASFVYLADGAVGSGTKSNAYYVWPVRGGQ